MLDNAPPTPFSEDICTSVTEANKEIEEEEGCYVSPETPLHNSYPFIGAISMNSLKSI